MPKLTIAQMILDIESSKIEECDLSPVSKDIFKSAEEAAKIFEAIKKSDKITKLNASFSINGPQSLKILSEALKGSNLADLNLSGEAGNYFYNHFRGESEGILIDLLLNSPKLTSLNIEMTGIRFEILKKVLEDSSLTQISFTVIDNPKNFKSGIDTKQQDLVNQMVERNCLKELNSNREATVNLPLPPVLSNIVISYIMSAGTLKFLEMKGENYANEKLQSQEFSKISQKDNNQPSSTCEPEESKPLKQNPNTKTK